ncbi:MAG: TIGR00300 family protein [Candidatus Altiarchaeales archaeon A3]|nr:MAG: TIGR00300 family protein [Candidatus Altiarchaeales archaeon A3]
MEQETIELKGHIIDSLILPKVFDTIMEEEGNFDILDFKIGKKKTEPSYAKILVNGKDIEHLNIILQKLQKLGAVISVPKDAETEIADMDGCAPENFCPTTNQKTYVRINCKWNEVRNQKMDSCIIIENGIPLCKLFRHLKKGDNVVVGLEGIKIEPIERSREPMGLFGFMRSETSTEKPTITLIKEVANELKKIKKSNGKIGVVCGSAVIHTGASRALAEIINLGYVDAFFAGNAVAVRDIEYETYGTSLGMNIETGKTEQYGYRKHTSTINSIIRIGSIKKAIDEGIIKHGMMYELVTKNIPYVLAGSIRDDGPLPDVITDICESQDKMRELLQDLDLVLMMGSLLHSIAAGNLMKAETKVICVDINPEVVTKLRDRGTTQAIGIVTDLGTFIPILLEELKKK